ncbi:MAG: hypothetical protein JXQ99_01980 [Hyphomicrobiaceae bacterium]
MTNRLHILERERERLEAVLAEDPHWQALCEIQRRAPETDRPPVVSADIVAGLNRSEAFAMYRRVVKAIAHIQKMEAVDPPEASTEHGTPQIPTTHQGDKQEAEQQEPPDKPQSQLEPDGRVDDLTAIRQIDRRTAKALNELGVFSFKAVAYWDRHDVRAVRDALDLGKRISRENWIEQAALLHMRAPERAGMSPDPELPKTQAQSNPVEASASPTDEADASVAIQQPAVSGPSVPAAQTSLAIEGEQHAPEAVIETAIPEALPAALEHSGILAPPEPVAADQVTIDAETAPATTAVIAIETPSVPEQPTEPIRPALPPRETFKVGRRPRRLPAPAARRFSYLSGVSDQMAEALRSAGVTSLNDIAAWSRADVKWFRAILGNDARISHDQWIEQAAVLSNGMWTRHALRVVSGEASQLVARPAELEVCAPAYRLKEPTPEPQAVAQETVVEAVVDSAPEIAPATANPDTAPELSVIDDKQSRDSNDHPSKQNNETATETTEESVESAENTDQPQVVTPLFSERLPRPPPTDEVRQAPMPSNENNKPTASPSETPTDIEQQAATVSAQDETPATPPPVPIDRFNPMRGLATTVALGKIKRPPPDLGTRPRHLKPPRKTPPPLPESPPAEPSKAVEPIVPSDAASSIMPPAGPEPAYLQSPSENNAVEAAPDVKLDEDWNDAEALVIKRAEPATATPTPPLSTSPVTFAPHEERPPQSSSSPPADDPDEDEPWGDEAEVVIVSRPRAEAPATPEPQSTASPLDQARQRIGAATDFISRRIQNARAYDDDIDTTSTAAGYHDNVEEATVTIIRAESSQENAASVVPDNIANDAEAPAQPAKRPVAKTIGSRFLKALTGD